MGDPPPFNPVGCRVVGSKFGALGPRKFIWTASEGRHSIWDMGFLTPHYSRFSFVTVPWLQLKQEKKTGPHLQFSG